MPPGIEDNTSLRSMLDEEGGKGTIRPYQGAVQPREESQRRLMRLARASDGPHQERVRWYKEVQAFIASTSDFKDHWRDPRWDELPPEWEFKPWRARKIREKLLTLRKRRVD
jgi:hypothetical protein